MARSSTVAPGDRTAAVTPSPKSAIPVAREHVRSLHFIPTSSVGSPAPLSGSVITLTAGRGRPTAPGIRGPSSGLDVTHKACEVAAREGDSEQYYADNRDFHEAIYRACRNSFLADQAFALRKRLSAYRRIQLRARNSLLQSLQEHAGILKAIRAGDEQLAASRLHDHVLVQGERFSDTVLGLAGDRRSASAGSRSGTAKQGALPQAEDRRR